MDPFPSAPTTQTDRVRRRRSRSRGIVAVVVATAAVLLLAIAPTTAATVNRTWRAKVGTAGANGAITVVTYVSGTGAATLRLKALPASAMIAVSLRAGTCAKPGSVAAALTASRSSSTGSLSATRTLAATAVTRLRAAKSLVATIRSGSFSRCATLARLSLPTPSPSPSPSGDVGTLEVRAAGFAFTPTSLTANAGVPFTVEFRNDDAGIGHGFNVGTATTSTPIFSAPILTGAARETFTVAALAAGTYVFYCPVHPTMKGTLTVRGVGSGPTPSPTPSPTASPDATSSPTSAPTASPPGTPEPTPTYYPYP